MSTVLTEVEQEAVKLSSRSTHRGVDCRSKLGLNPKTLQQPLEPISVLSPWLQGAGCLGLVKPENSLRSNSTSPPEKGISPKKEKAFSEMDHCLAFLVVPLPGLNLDLP